MFLHGGWGYEIYAIDRQIAELSTAHRFIVPDRTGYGRSAPIDSFPVDFHRRAMDETHAVISGLGLERPVVWGHSDGAIIALLLALAAPAMVAGAIVEAAHFYRRKPRSRAFFESVAADPSSVGESVAAVLAREHGPRWMRLLEQHARAWLSIADAAAWDTEDFYDGRLGEIATPVLAVHGARDPRTEAGELDALVRALGTGGPTAFREIHVLPEAGHSPHSERATADQVTELVGGFARRTDVPEPRKRGEARRSANGAKAADTIQK